MFQQLILIFLSSSPLVWTQDNTKDISDYYIKTTNLKCFPNPEWAVNVSCKLKAINWEKTVANLSMDLVRPLKNISIHVELFRREDRYIPFIINITRNVCDVFNNQHVHFYERIALKLFKQFSNFKHPRCPLTGHVQLTNIYLNVKSYRVLLLEGAYKAVTSFTEGYPPQPIGSIQVDGIVNKKILRGPT